jgi:hypothetical protein
MPTSYRGLWARSRSRITYCSLRQYPLKEHEEPIPTLFHARVHLVINESQIAACRIMMSSLLHNVTKSNLPFIKTYIHTYMFRFCMKFFPYGREIGSAVYLARPTQTQTALRVTIISYRSKMPSNTLHHQPSTIIWYGALCFKTIIPPLL